MFISNNLIHVFFNHNVILILDSRERIYDELSNNYVEIHDKILLIFDKRYEQIVEYALIRKFEKKRWKTFFVVVCVLNDKLRYNSFVNSYVLFESRRKMTSVKQMTLKNLLNIENNAHSFLDLRNLITKIVDNKEMSNRVHTLKDFLNKDRNYLLLDIVFHHL